MNDGEACNDVRVADSESVALASVAEPSAPSTEAEKRVAFLERNLLAYEEVSLVAPTVRWYARRVHLASRSLV